MLPELEQVILEVEKVIAGKRDVIGRLILALLADGHVLLDDVPGVGKTTLAVALSRAVGLRCRRIQFTPDVLPTDITGFSMPDREGGFTLRPGLLEGNNLVLGDEINRASSKTQSALLEAMEERQVTVDGRTCRMETPFLVIATENSVGTAGTQPLPYAQMDRFMMRLSIGYPDHDAQMALLRARQGSDPMDGVRNVLTREQLILMQEEVRSVTAADPVLDYITRLTFASRDHAATAVGISPRGALFLDRAAKASAYMDGRDYVTGADVAHVFSDVCAHRIVLKDQNVQAVQVISDLLRSVRSADRGQSGR